VGTEVTQSRRAAVLALVVAGALPLAVDLAVAVLVWFASPPLVVVCGLGAAVLVEAEYRIGRKMNPPLRRGVGLSSTPTYLRAHAAAAGLPPHRVMWMVWTLWLPAAGVLISGWLRSAGWF